LLFNIPDMSANESEINQKSLFISRKLDEDSIFHQLADKYGMTITDIPLIKIVKIPFSHTPKTDWIFFSSKNGIRFFFTQNPEVAPTVKYGVIGPSSAKTLAEYGKQADFIGKGTDLVNTGKDFRDVLGNDSILFPQAMDSLKTIQKQLAFTNTTYNIYTYKTILRTDFELPYADIVIFTSPSNVSAYLAKYKLDPRQLVIAMGRATQYKLAEHGIRNALLPNEYSEKGLYDILAKVFALE
jgi:hydroxymethylbilane synthase